MTRFSYIYHYTSAEALISILGNHTLWATDIDYLNDSREGTIARQHLLGLISSWPKNDYARVAIEKFLRAGAHLFLISFSMTSDNLSLYRTYGPSHGAYCIGFDREYLLKTGGFAELVDCNYEAVSQRQEVEALLREMRDILSAHEADGLSPEEAGIELIKIRDPDLTGRLLRLSAIQKSPEFLTEKESRLFVKYRPAVDQHFRTSQLGHVIVPYHELELSDEPTTVHVTMGPNTNSKLARSGLERLRSIMSRPARASNWIIDLLGHEVGGFRTL